MVLTFFSVLGVFFTQQKTSTHIQAWSSQLVCGCVSAAKPFVFGMRQKRLMIFQSINSKFIGSPQYHLPHDTSQLRDTPLFNPAGRRTWEKQWAHWGIARKTGQIPVKTRCDEWRIEKTSTLGGYSNINWEQFRVQVTFQLIRMIKRHPKRWTSAWIGAGRTNRTLVAASHKAVTHGT